MVKPVHLLRLVKMSTRSTDLTHSVSIVAPHTPRALALERGWARLTTTVSKDMLRNMCFDRSAAVRDPGFLRAMAHPLRMKLGQLLSVHGPMTATELSELVDESPANCSFHLRKMARWGFIEEAPGGKGRERRWKAKTGGWGVDPEDLSTEGKAAHRALRAVQRQHLTWQEEQWEDRKHEFAEEWRRQVFTYDWEGPLSAEQLREISDGFGDVLRRVQRSGRQQDAVRVHIHINAIPIGDPPPAKGGSE